MHGFVLGYYRFSMWTLRLAYVNICWIIFMLAGLLVFGFMPATAAMFSIIRKWLTGDENIPVFSTFAHHFKQSFTKTNGLGITLFLIGYLLITEFQILRMQESVVFFAVSIAVLLTFILYAVVLIYFFPIFVHFRLTTIDYIKWPFIIGIVHPVLTIFTVVGLGIIYYVTWITIPALFFFFGGSVTALIVMWAVSQTFPKYEETESFRQTNNVT